MLVPTVSISIVIMTRFGQNVVKAYLLSFYSFYGTE